MRARPSDMDFRFRRRELGLEIAQSLRRAARGRGGANATDRPHNGAARPAFYPAVAQFPIYGTNKILRATRAACTRELARVALYEPRCGTANASFHARICVPVVTEVRSSIRFLMRSSSPRRWSM